MYYENHWGMYPYTEQIQSVKCHCTLDALSSR